VHRCAADATPTPVADLTENMTINVLDSLASEELPAHPHDPESGVFATVDSAGRPSARVLHLRRCDDRGLVFFINTSTRKGHDLKANPRVALTFYWAPLLRQVNIIAISQPTSPADSDLLWHEGSITGRAASLASQQGEPVSDEQGLHDRAREIVDSGTMQRRPSTHQGLLLTPQTVEFWLGRPDRLHRRVHYSFAGGEQTHWSLQP
jgi:pyridoxine/pyridoxamine 5'-phosphate oxidase